MHSTCKYINSIELNLLSLSVQVIMLCSNFVFRSLFLDNWSKVPFLLIYLYLSISQYRRWKVIPMILSVVFVSWIFCQYKHYVSQIYIFMMKYFRVEIGFTFSINPMFSKGFQNILRLEIIKKCLVLKSEKWTWRKRSIFSTNPSVIY